MKFFVLLVLSCVTVLIAVDAHGPFLCHPPSHYCGKTIHQYTCCSAKQPCAQGTCCATDGPINIKGACCSRAGSCGKVCCDDQAEGLLSKPICANAKTGLCCSPGEADTKGICCSPGNVNCKGQCCGGSCSGGGCTLTSEECKAQGFISNCSPQLPCPDSDIGKYECNGGCCHLTPQ